MRTPRVWLGLIPNMFGVCLKQQHRKPSYISIQFLVLLAWCKNNVSMQFLSIVAQFMTTLCLTFGFFLEVNVPSHRPMFAVITRSRCFVPSIWMVQGHHKTSSSLKIRRILWTRSFPFGFRTHFQGLLLLVIGEVYQNTSMTIENQPFEDVFPIEHRDFPMSNIVIFQCHVSFQGCIQFYFSFIPFWLEKNTRCSSTASICTGTWGHPRWFAPDFAWCKGDDLYSGVQFIFRDFQGWNISFLELSSRLICLVD